MSGGEVFLSDNSGNRVPPGVVAADPVAASGITLSGASAGVDYTQTVVGGKTYLVTIPIDDGTWLFSITGLTSVAANREWVGVEGVPFTITIPRGVTTLYFESDTVGVAYMVELAE
jgi:hypothetical protein